MQDKEFSQALELLRFPLALMVVILHVFAWSSTIDSGWEHLDTFRMVNYARAINIAAFADTRVPLYFFMAGSSGLKKPYYSMMGRVSLP